MSSTSEELTTPTSIADLQPKMELAGVVKRVELYGAFIDLGLERDGLVHISQMSDQRVDKATDVVKQGDQVKVWVSSVDPEQGRIALTMVRPPQVEWRDLAEGQIHTGRVVRMEQYGVFVDIGAERPGLLHVREMAQDQYVRHPSDVVKEGAEVEVRIRQIDRRKKRIDLTMEGLDDTIPDEDAEETDLDAPSLMEYAFTQAREEARRRKRQQRESKHSKKRRAEQDDILARTLERHRDR